MIDLALDTKTHDLIFHKGDLKLTGTESEFVRQSAKVRLQTIFGEWFLDEYIGLPYFEVLGKKISSTAFAHLAREALMDVAGVQEVKGLQSEFESKSRKLKLHFELKTKDGRHIKDEAHHG